MSPSNEPNVEVINGDLSRLCQGDIIRNIEYIESVEEKDGLITIRKINFPHIIVLTQECDLKQDSTCRTDTAGISKRPLIMSVLVAPIYNIEHLRRGEHLSELEIRMPVIDNNSAFKEILKNEIPRYNYLLFEKSIDIVPSVIDFKHYFSVDVNTLLERKKTDAFVGQIAPPYREKISQRFSYYLARIGLPKGE